MLGRLQVKEGKRQRSSVVDPQTALSHNRLGQRYACLRGSVPPGSSAAVEQHLEISTPGSGAKRSHLHHPHYPPSFSHACSRVSPPHPVTRTRRFDLGIIITLSRSQPLPSAPFAQHHGLVSLLSDACRHDSIALSPPCHASKDGGQEETVGQR